MESRIDSSDDNKNGSIKKRLDKLAEDIKKLPPERVNQLEKFMEGIEKKFFSIGEAAQILDVSKDTIRRALKAGKLKGVQLTEGGDWRISRDEINKFL